MEHNAYCTIPRGSKIFHFQEKQREISIRQTVTEGAKLGRFDIFRHLNANGPNHFRETDHPSKYFESPIILDIESSWTMQSKVSSMNFTSWLRTGDRWNCTWEIPLWIKTNLELHLQFLNRPKCWRRDNAAIFCHLCRRFSQLRYKFDVLMRKQRLSAKKPLVRLYLVSCCEFRQFSPPFSWFEWPHLVLYIGASWLSARTTSSRWAFKIHLSSPCRVFLLDCGNKLPNDPTDNISAWKGACDISISVLWADTHFCLVTCFWPASSSDIRVQMMPFQVLLSEDQSNTGPFDLLELFSPKWGTCWGLLQVSIA